MQNMTSSTVPLTIIPHIDLRVGALEEVDADAIVTILPNDLEWRGSLNQSLLLAAGKRLDDFVLENVYQPKTGDAFAVPGFGLAAKHLIIAVTPPWGEGLFLNDRDLLNAYRKPLELAARSGFRSVAFGALGTGAKAWPARRAARLALRAIRERWYDDLERLEIVCKRPEIIDAFAAEIDAGF